MSAWLTSGVLSGQSLDPVEPVVYVTPRPLYRYPVWAGLPLGPPAGIPAKPGLGDVDVDWNSLDRQGRALEALEQLAVGRSSPVLLQEEDGALEAAVSPGVGGGHGAGSGSLASYLMGVSPPQSRVAGLPWSVLPVLGEVMPQRFGPAVFAARLLSRVRRTPPRPQAPTAAPELSPLTPYDRALRRGATKKGRPRTGTTSTTPATSTEKAKQEDDPSFQPGAVAEVVDIELDDNDPVIEDSTALPLEIVEPEHLPAVPEAPSSTAAPSIAVVTTESEYELDRRLQRETARLNLDVLRRTVTMLQQETNKLGAEREMMTANRDMLRAQVRLVNTDRSRVDSARRKLDLERDMLQSQMLGRAFGGWPGWMVPAVQGQGQGPQGQGLQAGPGLQQGSAGPTPLQYA